MKRLLILLFILFPFSLFAFHDHQEKPYNKHLSPLENMLNSTENKLKYIYDSVNDFSKYLDEKITGEKSQHTYEDSYIHMQVFYEHIESQKDDVGIDLKIRLRLPQLKEKFNLVLENDDDTISQEYDDTNETVPYQDNKFNLALQYKTIKDYINLKAKAGAKLSSNPYLFISGEANKNFPLTNSWDLNLKEKLKLSTRKSLENTSSIEFHKRINGRIEFLNHNEYYWNEKDRIDNIYNSLRVNQKLKRRDSINYVSSVSSNNAESNLQTKEYNAYVSYKHYIRNWLYYDLVPRLFWNRENDFDTRYAFKINVGVIIGK